MHEARFDSSHTVTMRPKLVRNSILVVALIAVGAMFFLNGREKTSAASTVDFVREASTSQTEPTLDDADDWTEDPHRGQDLPSVVAALKAQQETHEQTVEEALARIEASGGSVSIRTLMQLSKIAVGHEWMVIDALASAETPTEKSAFARVLSWIGTPEAVEALVTHTHAESDEELRAEMARAISEMRNVFGLETLVSVLGATDDPDIIGAVIETTSRLASADTVEFLVELYLEDPRIPNQREQVLSALGALRNPDVEEPLRLVAEKGEGELASAAAAGLDAMRGAIAAVSVR